MDKCRGYGIADEISHYLLGKFFGPLLAKPAQNGDLGI